MTKARVFGQDCKVEKPKKKIDLVKALYSDQKFRGAEHIDAWGVIVLMERGYTDDGLDLMWTYHESNPNLGRLYLGHWNDGVL